MAGGRGRGGGRGGHGSTPPAAGGGRFGDSSGNHDRGRGRGRGGDRGRGRGGGRDSSTPGRGSQSYGSPAGPAFASSPAQGGGYRQSPGGYSGRGGGRSGRGHFGAEGSGLSVGSGVAAVAAQDRELLLVGKDAKSPRVWELRIHPSQHFSSNWLDAVSRWAHNMHAAQQQWQQSRQQARQPPTPPPQPAYPRDIPDDDYDYSPNSSDSDDVQSDVQSAGDGGGNPADEDDTYDMVSYLQKMSLQDKSAAADNFSTATTAGSTCSGAKSVGARSAPDSRSGSQHPGSASKVTPARTTATGSAGKSRAAAAAADVEGSDDESSGEWETDSGAGEEQEDEGSPVGEDDEVLLDSEVLEQSEQGSVHGSDQSDQSQQDWSDADADAALIAAEEQDLLGEASPAPVSPPAGTAAAAAAPGAAAAGVGGSGAGVADSGRKGGSGIHNGQQQQQGGGRQELLLVSLRLERQQLTDKQAQLLSSWYTSTDVCGLLTLSKLWLFNNSLGDDAAPALAAVIAASPRLVELHLSHNQLCAVGAKALLAAVPTQRPAGLRPLWLRLEYNQINGPELETFIQQDCAARGLVVDVAKHVPAGERAVDTKTGRELNLAWNLPWKEVHVQMPWLSIQRAPPAEAAVLQAAKAVWGARTGQQQQQQQQPPAAAVAAGGRRSTSGGGGVSSSRGVSSRSGGIVAAMTAAASGSDDVPLPLQYGTPPPPPPPGKGPSSSISSSSGGSGLLPPPPPGRSPFPSTATPPPPPPAAAAAAAASSSADDAPAGDVAVPSEPVVYQEGPLMLFLDTSALLAMLGTNSATPTAFKLSLLQTLANNNRFGRGLAIEQQTFLVLADTVLKQIDSLKSADTGVGGPVRKFLDRGLDEMGPKGLDFMTVLAAHEGEGLVLDRQAAVAGSRSPAFTGPTGQKNDLAIIEVALFFRKELLEAAAAATAEVQQQQLEGAAVAEAQPVILVTNDNAQLQLAKSHGLPAFKLAGAGPFESGLSSIIKGGGDLTSSALRSLMGPAATAGMGRVAQRSLQDDFDGAVACLKGLVEAYEDLSGVLGRISLLVNGVPPGSEAAALRDVQQLLQDHQHTTPFEATPAPAHAAAADTPAAGGAGAGSSSTTQQQQQSVLEATQGNLGALERTLAGWDKRLRSHHTPSRVLKWTSSGTG